MSLWIRLCNHTYIDRPLLPVCQDRPLLRPPQKHTYTMTPVCRNSVLRCQRRMHRTSWELLSGRACTFATLGARTPARAMRQRCHTVSVPPLHRHAQRRTWWVQ